MRPRVSCLTYLSRMALTGQMETLVASNGDMSMEFLAQSPTHGKYSSYANHYAYVPKQNINPSTYLAFLPRPLISGLIVPDGSLSVEDVSRRGHCDFDLKLPKYSDMRGEPRPTTLTPPGL